MTVNFEIKGMLARLLATEDLVVEHKKVDTACFNVHTRVLTLPLWEKASNIVYDMLVAHEVSHALYTPDEDWCKKYKIPPQFVNVVEDARVEKLIKRRYGGLGKIFYSAYRELQEEDFFAIGDDDISTYNLADRVNLYFKVGNFISINFNSAEKEIVELVSSAESFDDVLYAAKVLYDYCKSEQESEDPKIPLENTDASNQGYENFDQNSSEDDDQESREEIDDSQSNKSNNSNGSNEQEEFKSSGNTGGKTSEPEIKTSENFENAVKDLVSSHLSDTSYIEIPDLDLNSIIIPNNEVHYECKRNWDLALTRFGELDIFDVVDREFLEFKKTAQKEVNYLVKEFECKKAADSYARATVSKTGVLDCSKIYTYKYNEDLFKKVTTLSEGKNHGLVFILDWSGSMSEVLVDTIKQLYNLMWFCKKVDIPFEVYAFTNEWNCRSYIDENVSRIQKEHYVKKAGVFAIDYSFGLMNIFTSKVKTSLLEVQMKNIYRIAKGHERYGYCKYQVPTRFSLSGTPLNESLMTLHKILPNFKKEHKLQKVQCVVLTDGEACGMKYHKEVKRHWEDTPYIGYGGIYPNSYLRDRKTGHVYKISDSHSGLTDTIIENLRDKFVDVNFIGMRIISSRDASNFMRKYTYGNYSEYEKLYQSWKKNKSVSIKSSKYHTYFGLSASALNNSSEFVCNTDATKSQIKSAFAKSLSSKKMNKKVLNEFITLVA